MISRIRTSYGIVAAAICLPTIVHAAGNAPTTESVPAVNSLGGPDQELSADQQAQWLRGRALFAKSFKLAEGLGPLFGADSCRACHNQPVMGGAGLADVNVVRFGSHNTFTDVFSDLPGGQIVSKLSVPGRAREEVNPGANITQERNPPSLLGLGLIDRLPDGAFTLNANPGEDANAVISGEAAIIGVSVARFGWKADLPTLRDAVADALGQYLGITLDGTLASYAVTADDDGIADPELGAADFEDLVFYVSHLAPPQPQTSDLDPVLVAEGRALFESEAACNQCHVPQLIDAGNGATVTAYSDFLLHALRPPPSADPFGMADVTSGVAKPRDFRTPPLWGFRYTAPYLRNGKAYRLLDAMSAHGWEGLVAGRLFITSYTPAQQNAVLEYLKSL